MLKKVLLVMMAVVMLLLTAGCGDDFKGDWVRTIRAGKTTQFHILHLGKADNGDYVLEQEFKTFEKTEADGYGTPITYMFGVNKNSFTNGKLKTKDGDGILNLNEAITWKKDGQGLMAIEYPFWNGTKVKLLRQYKYNEKKASEVYKFKKEALTLKDGKLVLDKIIYKKTDKSKVDKMISDYKDNLKKQIGTEVNAQLSGTSEFKFVGVITKILIVKNGQEKEVLE